MGKREEAPPWEAGRLGRKGVGGERRRLTGGVVLFPDLGFHHVREERPRKRAGANVCFVDPA
jgi:hypothetical protein